MKRILSLLAAGSLLLSLAACNAAGAGDNTVRVVLDWTPNTNHTGLYVARELGYYEEAGLTVEIMQPLEDGALALVAAGKAEFAVGFQESLGPALTADAALPVTAVAAIVSHNTSGIISLKENNITTPKDLEGKRFAAWASPLVDAIMRTVIEADGGDVTRVEMLPNMVTDAVSALSADVDAIWIYEGWDGVAVDQSGLDYNYFSFADLDSRFDFYTPVLVGGDEYLSGNPEQVKAFMAATSKGYAYAIENPEAAADILVKAAPELSADMVLQSQQYLASRYQADAPYWGYIDSARWAAFYDWMYEEGLLSEPLGSAGFTNEYLPEAADGAAA